MNRDNTHSAEPREKQDDAARTIGIVGGGPGGLITAYLLQKRLNRAVNMTIFEATSRLGGKVLTPQFDVAPVRYEAGAAELYDYSPVDEDPLKELIKELGLSILPMEGNAVLMNGRFLGHLDDIQRHLGSTAREALQRFHWMARDQISPMEFFLSGGSESPPSADPTMRFDSALRTIDVPSARQFIEHFVHSDLATEPSETSLDYGLQNYLMNDPAYMNLYGIEGGNEQLPQRLADRIQATILRDHAVRQIGKTALGQLQVRSQHGDEFREDEFDFVVVAIPLDVLMKIDFAGQLLKVAMRRHYVHYDYPAHYLRITILFQRPFWRGELVDSYCMMDQLGGCCLYDESSREAEPQYGILGWLLGGRAAQMRADLDDSELIKQALASLPPQLAFGKELFLEGRVHRWIGAVNAIPGGLIHLPPDQRHQPEPLDHPGLFVVGDYLFDSTLNGVLDSADYVADWMASILNERTDYSE